MQDASTSRVQSAFRKRFGADPGITAVAPGRVNLIGDHVDYAGGLVLPIAIDRTTSVAIAERDEAGDAASRILAVDLDREIERDLSTPADPEPDGGGNTFANYVIGPIEQLREAGLRIPKMDIAIASSVPMGGGLSSSAALEVAVLLGIRRLIDVDADPLTLALEARRAEHRHAGTPCGIMDMYVSAAARRGHACLIDCATNALRQIPLPSEEEAVIMVTDTGTRHELNEGAYAERRRSCEEAAKALGHSLLGEASVDEVRRSDLPEPIRSRALHVVEEIARVLEFVESIERGALENAGRMMFESHASLRDLFEVSCPELDLLVDIATRREQDGVLGARMTGGGFGGCVVTLCRPDRAGDLQKLYEREFQKAFGRPPRSFMTTASAGAHAE